MSSSYERQTKQIKNKTTHFHRTHQLCDYIHHLLALALTWRIKSVFGNVVAVAFQIAFCAKINANDVFLFFKNHF
jgi:hypothetical protein